MEFIDPKIEAYAENHSSKEPQYLAELNRETHAKILQPRMLSGHLQGRTLAMLSQIKNPNAILEIGTYTGYSALCLAEGLAPLGQIHTIDLNEELNPMVLEYIKKAGFENKITTHIGNALDIIPTIQQNWDLVFIDADKSNYINYLDLVLPEMNTGGLIILDNVLWSGKVLKPTDNLDPDTQTLAKLNSLLTNHPRLETVLLPIRDGLTICRVK